MKKALIVLVMFVITGCSNLIIKSLPPQFVESRLFKIEQLNEQNQVRQASLLSVQFSETQWRWVQTDPLGAPLARLVLSEQGWQNDGFIMPNQQAKQLFTAIAVALNPDHPPFELNKNWQIQKNGMHFSITLPDGSQWKVNEL